MYSLIYAQGAENWQVLKRFKTREAAVAYIDKGTRSTGGVRDFSAQNVCLVNGNIKDPGYPAHERWEQQTERHRESYKKQLAGKSCVQFRHPHTKREWIPCKVAKHTLGGGWVVFECKR
jgi:hypothetical protein